MSLTLTSSDRVLNAALVSDAADGVISPVELQKIRDAADAHVRDATGSATKDADDVLSTSVGQFLSEADGAVEAMQRIALAARKGKLPADQRESLKAAIEHQVAYIVAGYQSSIQRL